MRWTKGHGTQNDFVVIPDPDGALCLSPDFVAAVCDRRSGLGADGVLRVVRSACEPDAGPAAHGAEWFMDYRNADGSVAEMCGNGVRVFARYLVASGLADAGELAIATRGGVKQVSFDDDGRITVDMGAAQLPPALAELSVAVGTRRWDALGVLMPNPHAVAFVEDLDVAGPLLDPPDVTPRGSFPEGVNVEFAARVGTRHLAMRVFERGSGETRSCGTGACAVMVAAARLEGLTGPSTWTVDVPGGRLTVAEREDGRVLLTGPAVLVASGALDRDWLAAVS
ncbi:MAG: diaminopimelate epimerase [Actinomycetota bacterium]|nr:diaminopimelate epimerase [Actinomycetota bacterium]